MIYNANITTPANTPKTELKKTIIHVTKGLVYKAEFYFPYGSEGKMGVAVFDGLFQVWPSNIGEFFIGSNINISFDDLYLKASAPFEFQCYSYNTDDIFDHLVSVKIGLVSSEVFMARFMPTKTYEYLTKLIKKMEEERLEQQQEQRERIKKTPFKWLTRRS